MNDSSEVKLHFLDYWRVVKVRWAILTIIFLLVVVTAGVTCYFLPREFFSKVTLEVKSDSTTMQIFGNSTGMQSTNNDPRLAPTQFQILQSKEILNPVIENLKLAESWGTAGGMGGKMPKEQAYAQMLKMMEMREVRNTDLIEIGVYSVDPQEAANIANTIAVVYQEKRRSDQQTLLKQGLGQLEEEVNKKKKAVEQAQALAQKIRTEQQIVDLNPESMDSTQGTEGVAVTQDTNQVNEAKIKIAELTSQLEQTDKLKPEELISALTALNIVDPTVSKILPLYQDSVSEEARMLNSGLGENHPKIKALRAQKAVFSSQLNEQIAALRRSLITKLNVQQATLVALTEKLKGTQTNYNTTRNQSVEYQNAKTSYISSKRIYEVAENRLETEKMQAQMSIYPGKIWEKAEPSIYPARPNVIAYMALAIVIGLIAGVGVAFFIEYLDTSVKTLEDVERYLDVPVLAVIPRGVSSLLKSEGDNSDAEAYRILRTNMEFNRKNPTANTITLVSGGPGEGKSTTLNNLAITCARGGYNVLIVDADLRRPSQHSIFGVDNSVGLSDCLMGSREVTDVIQQTRVENLSFLPSGKLPQDAVGILNSKRMTELIALVKSRYDLVFFDSPPILGVSDASILSSEVDLTIMVVQHRRFPRSMLLRVKQAVLQVGGNLLGAVLNNVDTRHDSGYQYYTQYYDYYTPETRGKSKKPSNASASISPRRETSNPTTHGDY
ncbi:MAG: polysaccharide biosynthesis tyrosine autokinase [Verrucomicrobiota bacterium]